MFISSTHARRFILSLLILLSILGVPARTTGARQAPASAPRRAVEGGAQDTLSTRDRVEVFDEVWETINEKYYDPAFNGVDWRAVRERYRPMVERTASDLDYYALLKKMVGELRDAHTRFHTPRERQERERLQAVTIGVSIFEVQGKTVIIAVAPASEAAAQGVTAGMILRTIDGRPVAERIAQAQPRIGGSSSDRAIRLRLYRKIVEGEPGTTVKLGLERADGTKIEATLTRRVVSDEPSVMSRKLASGFGYINLNLWKSPVHKQFRGALESLKDAPGVILDLRGNPGGEAAEVVRIASYFFNSRVSFGKFVSRAGKAVDLYTSRDDQVYKGAVVILVNEGSGSGSELFAGVMQEAGRATVIGRQSCGCVLGISKFRKVKGGGELAVSELGYVSPRGNKYEGGGITPDRPVALTIADLQRSRDLALEEAEAFLKTSKATVSNQR